MFVETTIQEPFILKRIKKQDMQALLDWFEARQSKFYKIGWAYLKDHHDVEDVFHNAILKVYDNIGQLQQDRYFETWVTSIFLNECRGVYRRRGRHVMEEPPDAAEESPAGSRLELMEHMDKLDSDQKEAILLKYIQGYSQQEIAIISGVPVGTVKSRLYRGLAKLRKLLEGGEGNGL